MIVSGYNTGWTSYFYPQRVSSSRKISWKSSYLNHPQGKEYFIPNLRQLVKKTIEKCYGCKRFRVSHYLQPSTGLLPVERTTQNLPFKVIGVDYVGPLICKAKAGKKLRYTYYLHAVLSQL